MDRREALKRITLLLGGAASTSALAALLQGCQSAPDPAAWTPATVTPEQNKLVLALSECILPETDTPGAAAAGVNTFIDHMLTGWMTPAERNAFLAGLADVDTRSRSDYGAAYADATPEQQNALMAALEAEAYAAPPVADVRPFYFTLKSLTLVGYYTSEVGATQTLNWLAAPGYYDGCVPYADLGKAWA